MGNAIKIRLNEIKLDHVKRACEMVEVFGIRDESAKRFLYILLCINYLK